MHDSHLGVSRASFNRSTMLPGPLCRTLPGRGRKGRPCASAMPATCTEGGRPLTRGHRDAGPIVAVARSEPGTQWPGHAPLLLPAHRRPATFVDLPIPRVECLACAAVRQDVMKLFNEKPSDLRRALHRRRPTCGRRRCSRGRGGFC